MKKILPLVFITMLAIFALPFTAFAADTQPPSDVENFKGVPLNGAAKLMWDAATDNTAVKGYQVYYGKTSVTASGQVYETHVDAGNVLQYTITGLENQKPYYFSVIAYDEAQNESLSWAKEISLTPSAEYGTPQDTDSPQVTKVEALNKEEVSVEFSEEIVIPAEDPQDAFNIENDETFEALAVLDAKMYEEDATKKTVLLTTAAQALDAKYKLTVNIDIEDKAGNPVISGTSDTALFTGSDKAKPATDTVGPEILKTESKDSTHVVIEFNETVVLSIDPSINFTITEELDALKKLSILGVQLQPNTQNVEDAKVTLVTSPQENKSYLLTISGLKDEAGNLPAAEKGTAKFTGKAAEGGQAADTTPPKDPEKLLSKFAKQAEKYVVTLMWNNPAENLGDVSEQTLYMNDEKKAALDYDAEKHEVSDLSAGEYSFKLTQKDAAGNESQGVSVKVVLAQTGPGLLGLVLVSLGLGRFICKRNKK